jgi:hypothetical protein
MKFGPVGARFHVDRQADGRRDRQAHNEANSLLVDAPETPNQDT